MNKKFLQCSSIKDCCDLYFKEYKYNNNRKAWLELRKVRYEQIRKDKFYLDNGAETFKNEVLKFWAGKGKLKGYNYQNSEIQKRDDKKWILFQDENGETVDSETILEELRKDNLELHGNYSWSKLFMGGDITRDMGNLKKIIV